MPKSTEDLKEYKKKYMREYRKNTEVKSKELIYLRKWRERNKKHIQNYNRKYRFEHRNEIKASLLNYRNKHKETMKVYDKNKFQNLKNDTNLYHIFKFKKDCRREARRIYAKYYGINLNSNQIIHHLDCDCTNNKINNLYLFNSKIEHINYHSFLNKIIGEMLYENN